MVSPPGVNLASHYLLSPNLLWMETLLLTVYFFMCILQIVGLTLIIVPVSFKISAVLTSWPIVGGTIACGVFLMLLSIAGIYGAIKHHQIILFFVSFVEISLPVPKMNCSLEKRKNRTGIMVCLSSRSIFGCCHGYINDSNCTYLSQRVGLVKAISLLFPQRKMQPQAQNLCNVT